MNPSTLNELRAKDLLTEHQYDHLQPIYSRKIVSVFYELRTLLYLGVTLFTTGVGILIYKNIGELGHLLSIIALFILTIGCFTYAFRKAGPYSNERVVPPTPVFDYVVLAGALLFISVLGYLQFQYGIFDESLGATTLVTALFFFYVAYRFDHLGVLSLAITALASFWSLTISPGKWYSGDFFEKANLHHTALLFGASLGAAAIFLDTRSVKQHFTFTYMNFCSLIYLSGALAGMFMNYDIYGWYFIALFIGCGGGAYFAHLKRSFLFLLYAFLFGYIGITFFLVDTVLTDVGLWYFYFIASCGGFVFFIVRFKNYFKRTV